jgi:hypothetical protein
MHLTSLNTSLCAEYYVLQHPWSVEEVCESEDANIRYEVIHYEASQQYGICSVQRAHTDRRNL